MINEQTTPHNNHWLYPYYNVIEALYLDSSVVKNLTELFSILLHESIYSTKFSAFFQFNAEHTV